jgi:hypothetical protein
MNEGASDMISEAELDKQADAILEAEVARRRAALKEEIAAKLRRDAERAHHAKINAHHPIEDPPTPEEIAERHRLADEGLARDDERIRKNNERFAREEAERTKRETAGNRLPRMQSGPEGFRVKRIV